MNMRQSLTCLAGVLFSLTTQAGSDPVAWSLTPASGFPATQVGHHSAVQYTLTNRLPFPALLVTDRRITGGTFSVHDECNNQTIAPGASCDITVGFSPSTDGQSSFQLIYGYHNNRIPLPTLFVSANGHPVDSALKGVIRGLPATVYKGNTPDYELIFTNVGDDDLSGCTHPPSVSLSGPGETGVSNVDVGNDCTNDLLKGHSCTYHGRLENLNALGALTVTGSMTCTTPSTVTASPRATTFVQNDTGCVIHGTVRLPLPKSTYQYADNVVQYEFENECASSGNPVTLGTVQVVSNQGARITKPALYDHCSGQTLIGGEKCTVMASVIPQQTASASQPLVVTASVKAGTQSAYVITSAPVLTNQQSSHHVKFVNQCDFDVWYGIANGVGGKFSPDPNLASNPQGAPPSSYYLPKQIPGLAPSVIDLVVPEYLNGAIWPRTGCTFSDTDFVCATGTCATMPNSATCNSTGGFVQPISPYTKFEFTITAAAGNDGVYDVSVINGFNVPVEIKAFGPTTNDPFNCTGAGALIQPEGSSLGACPWMFNPASSFSGLDPKDFLWVTPGSDNGCGSGSNCGMAYNTYTFPPTAPNQIVRRNGDFMGYSTLTNYQGYPEVGQWGSINLFTKYAMGSAVPASTYGNPNVWGVLYACIITDNGSADSCYNANNTQPANCCGCVDWQNEPVGVRTATSMNCLSKNTLWTSTRPSGAPSDFTLQKGIMWLKEACPTAYSYQFDDKASSFQCNNDGLTKLYTSYQITFCPGGVTGKPEGLTEGRSILPS